MQVVVRAADLTSMSRHGEASYPDEGAGFLIGRMEDGQVFVEAILPLENRREREARFNRYELGPQDFARAELEAARRGLDVVGVFHSHPDHPAQPSQFDLDNALPHFSYLIVSVERGIARLTRAWWLRPDRSVFNEAMLVVAEDAEV